MLTSFDDLEDNGVYVATSGEPFKRIPYPLTLGDSDYADRKGQLQNERANAGTEVRQRVHTASYFARNVKQNTISMFIHLFIEQSD